MPELPDVEVFRHYFNRTSLHKKIESIDLEEKNLLSGISSQKLKRQLKGSAFLDSLRIGKYLLTRYDDNKWLVLHFGMTGGLQYYKNEETKPDYARMIINFENGYSLAFDNRRKLGKIGLTDDLQEFRKEHKLGPDPYTDKISEDQFLEMFGNKKGMLKSALMDQKFIAGIGNVWSDEIMYQSGIHPERKVEDLSKKEIKLIYKKMFEVFQTGIDTNAEPGKFPENWLLIKRKDGTDCGICSGTVKKERINGRGCYFCNKHQK